MRKYFRIIIGFIRLVFEKIINGNKLELHGIYYCVSGGVKFWLHNQGTCDLGRKTWLSENCIFEANGGNIEIGFNNFFNTNCRIISLGKISVGDNNLFGPNVTIVDHDHKFDKKDKLINQQGFSVKNVKIGNDVWLGANVTICKGVNICDHVVIGANSVVTKSIERPGLYCGAPAVFIRKI